MSNCCRCKRRGVNSGWIAFWGLVLLLALSSRSNTQQGLTNHSDNEQEVSDQQAVAQMSVSSMPTLEQDMAIERLLSEMEEQGRRLPKI